MGEFKKSGGFSRGGGQGQGFNNRRGGSSSDRPRFGGDRGGFSRHGGDMGDRDGARAQMFSAVCNDCNRKCEVPFRPTGDRPVFCNDCFSNKRGSSQREAPARDFPRRDFVPSAISSKPPTEDKRIDDLKWQLDTVNKKLDTIMEMMKTTPKMEVVNVAPAIEAVKINPIKKAKIKKLVKAKK